MSESGKEEAGRPRNSFKKDFTFYTGGGKGGGAGGSVAGVTRFSFWIDHNRFATRIKELIFQTTFKVYSDADFDGMFYYPKNQVPLRLYIDQSNDAPDEVIREKGILLTPDFYTGTLTADVDYVTQPTDPNYVHDQGKHHVNAYSGNGFSFGIAKVVQSFTPQSPLLTGIWLRDLWRVGDTSIEANYSDLVVEVWDKNKNVIGSMTIDKRAGQNGRSFKTEYYRTVNGTNYWTEYDEILVKPLIPIRLEPGATHYFVVRTASATASNYYAIGANIDSGGTYNGNGRYIFGQAYSATFSGTTLTSLGTDVDLCFVTERNLGRTCATFLWDSSSYYWYDPADPRFRNQFKFIKENFDQVI